MAESDRNRAQSTPIARIRGPARNRGTEDTTLVHKAASPRDVAAVQAAGRPKAASPEAYIGTVIDGTYRIEGMIAPGGMAFVYHGVHLPTGAQVAIKLMDPELSQDPSIKKRCLGEARAMMEIKSSYIVNAMHVGELPGGQPFLVMEYLHGEDLDRTVAREGPLPWPRVAYMAIQICLGLASAHNRGIIHRDIKPQNCVRVEIDGDPDHIKIIDFGVAKKIEGETGLTKQGFLLGTPQYLAPEFRTGAKPSVSTDIYALGVTMYKMLTGLVPFKGKDAMETLDLHAKADRVPPSQAAPHLDIPVEADQIVGMALARDPRERFASAEAMSRALRSALGLHQSGLLTPPTHRVETSQVSASPPSLQANHPASGPPRPNASDPSAPAVSAKPDSEAARANVTETFDRRVLLLRAALLVSMSLLFAVGTWLVIPPSTTVASKGRDSPPHPPPRVSSASKPTVSSVAPRLSLDAPALVAPVPEAMATTEGEVAPSEERGEPQPALAEAPTAAEAPSEPHPELPSEPEPGPRDEPEPQSASEAEPDFNYTAAREMFEEQHVFLHNACMSKGDKPLTRLKLRVDVQPRGHANLRVFYAPRAVRDCVKQNMRFPYSASPRGGAFEYTLTETAGTLRGNLRPVPVDPRYVQVPAP